jgi:hypothetical protein
LVPERLHNHATALAMHPVLDGPQLHRTRFDGAANARVRVCNLEMNSHRRAANGNRSECSKVRVFVREHDDGAADAQFGVPNLSARIS